MVMIINGKEEYEEIILENKGKAIIDFYADWCAPCRMVSPILEEIAEENEDITVYKIDVDKNPELSMQFMVTSIPTLVLMNNGAPVNTLIGLRSKDDILAGFN